MAHISHKLKSSLEGAFAGGGDPATSPLYVFGPFLKLIVVAGVAGITYGVSIWLAVLTIVVVSAMYRLVMQWITDGSGGSGLSEEEFGPWAAKVNAAIYVLRYNYSKDIADMKKAEEYLAESLEHYRKLTELTKDTYLFAQSMQTSQRKIPFPGAENGEPANFHWTQILGKYEKELADLLVRVGFQIIKIWEDFNIHVIIRK